MMKRLLLILLALTSFSLSTCDAVAQFGGGGSNDGNPARPRPPEIGEPDANGGRMVTLRTQASTGLNVRVLSPDLTLPADSRGFGSKMLHGEDNEYELTIGPIAPGVYHYQYSHYAHHGWNLLSVPGDTLLDIRDVPHGVVAEISHYSPYQREFAHFQVYTPPGYEANDTAYPVLYLINNPRTPNETWLEIGRVNFILDNLIATGKARPMILVICDHPGLLFTEENPFRDEIRRYAEKNYRILPGQANRAIAGSDVLDIAFDEKNSYAYVGVFSYPPLFAYKPGIEMWETRYLGELTDPETKKGIRLLWLGYSKRYSTDSTVDDMGLLLARYGFPVKIFESKNENSWGNNREYLIELLPRLFQVEQIE